MARKKWHRNVLTHNEGKSAVAQSVIRTLKIKKKIVNAWLQYQKMCLLIT